MGGLSQVQSRLGLLSSAERILQVLPLCLGGPVRVTALYSTLGSVTVLKSSHYKKKKKKSSPCRGLLELVMENVYIVWPSILTCMFKAQSKIISNCLAFVIEHCA